MSKDIDLVFCYLGLVKVISQHKSLIPALLDLDAHFQPKQTESIFTLLKSLRDTAKVFFKCQTGTSKENSTEENKNAEKLATEIVSTFDIVEKACNNFLLGEEDDNDDDFQGDFENNNNKNENELDKDKQK